VARQARLDVGAEFLDEDLVAQALRFAYLLFAARQRDGKAGMVAGASVFAQMSLHDVLLLGTHAFWKTGVTAALRLRYRKIARRVSVLRWHVTVL
jgi:hypothetical protein